MNVVGIVPAAGQGTRLAPYRCAKELFPLEVVANDADYGRIRLACEFALDSLVEASVSKAFVIVSDEKFEVVKTLSDGSDFDLSMAYLHQRDTSGLASAIDCAHVWSHDSVSVLVLPDTLFEPRSCVRRIVSVLVGNSADVVLGVFPTARPLSLCPVELDSTRTHGSESRDVFRVVALHDKCRDDIPNTWGVAAWKPVFGDFLHRYLAEHQDRRSGSEVTLAQVINAFLASNGSVLALPFPEGRFFDIGTPASLANVRKFLLEGGSRASGLTPQLDS